MPKLPLSEKRLAANRANARKSTGPRSPEGKRRASRNNTRHGLYSAEVHLPEYWELRAIDTAQRAAAGYLRDPGLAAAVAARTYLRAHRSYATALVDRYYVERFSSADPHAYGRQNNNWFLAAIRYADHIRRQIRALDRFITPALLSYENETALAMTVGQAARPISANLRTWAHNSLYTADTPATTYRTFSIGNVLKLAPMGLQACGRTSRSGPARPVNLNVSITESDRTPSRLPRSACPSRR